jgi:hypothetical protein
VVTIYSSLYSRQTSAGTLRTKSQSRAHAPIIVAHPMTTHITNELS